MARGGLRWSDRPEDFRTEVLGLVKAQMVKNTVIVPVGSKGGFVLKKAPPASEREAYHEGRRGLLPGLPARAARPDRQPRRRPGGAAAAGAPAGRRRPVPGGGGRQGHGHLLRPCQCHLGRVRPLAGRRLRLRRQRRLRPQGHGHHRARRLGKRQAPLPRTGPGHAEPGVQRGRRRRHVGRRVRQRHAAVAAHPADRRLRPPPCVHRPDARRGRVLCRARAAVQAAALVVGRLRRQPDLGRRRRLVARREVDPAVAAGACGAGHRRRACCRRWSCSAPS